ncbi:MAG: IS3 family transposase, partial [Acidobacteriota bacterium]|nr:IS3 family transposase [Acidobacteriota bacterium]
ERSQLGLPRSSYSYEPRVETDLSLRLMRRIDEVHLNIPFYGIRQMAVHLCRERFEVNRKRAQRLVRKMEVVAIHSAPRTTVEAPEHRKYPYPLPNFAMDRPD